MEIKDTFNMMLPVSVLTLFLIRFQINRTEKPEKESGGWSDSNYTGRYGGWLN